MEFKRTAVLVEAPLVKAATAIYRVSACSRWTPLLLNQHLHNETLLLTLTNLFFLFIPHSIFVCCPHLPAASEGEEEVRVSSGGSAGGHRAQWQQRGNKLEADAENNKAIMS